MTSPVRDRVVVHDFRTLIGPAGRGAVDIDLGPAPRGIRRMVAIVPTGELLSRHELFMDRSAWLRVICVAVGAPNPDDVAVLDPDLPVAPLVAPAVLANDGMATLWVGDESEDSFLWAPDQDTPEPTGPLLDPDTAPLSQLVRCLQAPEVFDAVFDKVTAVPNHVALPGLRVRSGGVSQLQLRAAREAAVEQVLGLVSAPGAGHDPELWSGPVAEVLAGGIEWREEFDPVQPGSELDARRQAARRAYGRAAGLVATLPSVTRLLGSRRPGQAVWRAVTTAGAELAGFRDAVAQLLDQGHRAGEDGGGAARLARLGVAMPLAPTPDRGTLLKAVVSTVSDALGRRPALELDGVLRELADRAAPQGSAAYLPRLAALRDECGEARLTDPPPFPLRLLSPLALSAATFGTFLAGWAGWVFAIIAGLGWLLGTWLLAAREPIAGGERGWRAGFQPLLAGHVGAVTLGGGLGAVAAGWLGPPGWLAGALAVLGAAVLGVTLWRWWTATATRWAEQLAMLRPGGATGGYESLLARVVAAEWRLAGERYFLADVALMLAGALRQAAGHLRAAESGPARGDGQPWAPASAPEPARTGRVVRPDRALVDLLAEDYADVLQVLLDRCREHLAGGAVPGREWVEAEVGALVREHSDHLRRHGVHGRPPFSRRGPRAVGASAGWGSIDALAELVMAPAAGLFVQMCAEQHRSLHDRTGMELVRFAPRALEEQLVDEFGQRRASAVATEMSWTSVGSLVGVVRLVRPRRGVVELVWPKNTDDQPDLHGHVE